MQGSPPISQHHKDKATAPWQTDRGLNLRSVACVRGVFPVCYIAVTCGTVFWTTHLQNGGGCMCFTGQYVRPPPPPGLVVPPGALMEAALQGCWRFGAGGGCTPSTRGGCVDCLLAGCSGGSRDSEAGRACPSHTDMAASPAQLSCGRSTF